MPRHIRTVHTHTKKNTYHCRSKNIVAVKGFLARREEDELGMEKTNKWRNSKAGEDIGGEKCVQTLVWKFSRRRKKSAYTLSSFSANKFEYFF